MARYNNPFLSEFPFHVTGRRHNKAPFNIELDQVWTIMSELLYLTHHFFGLRIHAFVLMPNHFHLICSTGSVPLGTAVGYFMRESSKSMNKISGNINQTWGCRFYRCEIPEYKYFMNCYKYVYQNPVRAGLTSRCENWKYSTLNGLMGRNHLLIPTVEDTLLFSESGSLIRQNLNWLNTPAQKENNLAIQQALKKVKFKMPKNKNKEAHYLENALL